MNLTVQRVRLVFPLTSILLLSWPRRLWLLRIWLHIYNSTITPFLLHTDNELLRETDGSFTKYDFLFLSEGRVAFFFLSVWSSILVTRGFGGLVNTWQLRVISVYSTIMDKMSVTNCLNFTSILASSCITGSGSYQPRNNLLLRFFSLQGFTSYGRTNWHLQLSADKTKENKHHTSAEWPKICELHHKVRQHDTSILGLGCSI